MRPDIVVYEVGPRDGLQNEPETIATAAKAELVRRLAAAGLSRIEITSFVSPKWIPQLADADTLCRVVARPPSATYSALVPNEAGYERLRAAVLPVAAFFVSASETHNRKNVNRSVADHLERFRPVAERARADRVRLRAYVSTVCGCPYEGEVALGAVVDLVRQLDVLGADEISLGDTIGVGVPKQVRELVRAVAGAVALERVALHLHDTWGRALVNLQAGYEEGVRTFDASLGGLGGCPYAPGASGNVATEDVVDLFERAGIATGVDLDALVDATAWLERDVLHRALPGRVYRARLGQRERERSNAEGAA
ncbi:MAG: hydroxymethylglutaryl-CoA lyase [Proteobacteria bacterium]|nr:hydroxymethylglutaryl-CoA lyase [Pseudomonadota bacterium]